MRCSQLVSPSRYILSLEKVEARKEWHKNIARLSSRVQSRDLSEIASGAVSVNSDDEYHDAADASSDDQALRNYNVPVAALMIHAELPCV